MQMPNMFDIFFMIFKIFKKKSEAPLIIKPFLQLMTDSELFSVYIIYFLNELLKKKGLLYN